MNRGQWAVVVRMLCAVAVLFLNLGHGAQARPVVPGAMLATVKALSPAERTAYTLPDGSLPDLCLPSMPSKHGPVDKTCDICRIAHGFLLPPPADLGWLRVGEPMAHRLSAPRTHLPAHDWQSAAPRGPPSTILTA